MFVNHVFESFAAQPREVNKATPASDPRTVMRQQVLLVECSLWSAVIILGLAPGRAPSPRNLSEVATEGGGLRLPWSQLLLSGSC